MPTTTIACPSCSTSLSVPAEAAGRTGRCPFCKNRFTVPANVAPDTEIDDDLITDWLTAGSADDGDEDDYGGRLGETLRQKQQEAPPDDDLLSPNRPTAEQPTAEESAATTDPPRHERPEGPPQPKAGSTHAGHSPAAAPEASSATHAQAETAADEPAAEAAAPSGEAADADQPHADEPHAHEAREHDHEHDEDHARKKKRRYKVESAIRPVEKSEQEKEYERRALMEQAMERRRRESAKDQDHRGDHARLNLLDVSSSAVMVGFEGRLLLRDAFRAAMPIRCFECGDTDRERMVARPFGWTDRGHQGQIPIGEVDARYETDIHANDTPREVVRRMPIMDELISPFNRPMPHYFCRRCAAKSTAMCSAYDSPRGVMCEVLVPDGRVALDWLGRVNGICGEEYERLEKEISRFESDAWQQLGDQLRRRIAAWFRLKDDEQFIAYINDSDFGKKDAGLAGVAITDRRLVFCKYHRHGTVKLSDPDVELLVVRNGPFYDLTCMRQGSPQKLVRLRPDDLELLKQYLQDLDALIHVQHKEA